MLALNRLVDTRGQITSALFFHVHWQYRRRCDPLGQIDRNALNSQVVLPLNKQPDQ